MTTAMLTTNWTVDIQIEEDPVHTTARAELRTPGGVTLRGTGQANRNPSDRPVARIGEEVACARALSELTHALLDYAAEEIETNVRRGEPV